MRVIFYAWNYPQLKNIPFKDLFWAFLHGIRFDLAVIAPICGLMALALLFLPKILSGIVYLTLSIFHLLLMGVNVVDIELINFTGRRFTVNSMYMVGEGRVTNLFQYVFLTLVVVGIILFYFWKTIPIYRKPILNVGIKDKIMASIFILVAALIMARGGLQTKPLSFVNAKIIDHPFAHQLVLNTPFAFLKSIGRKSLEKVHYYHHEKMLSLLNIKKSDLKSPKKPRARDPNVVILIVESLSSEYLSNMTTPFLKKLSTGGVIYDPAYANALRSVEGMAAILAGVPSLMEESFINSEFASGSLVGLGHILKTKNYHTSFFHGAQNGSMRFDSFSHAIGFDHYLGKNEFADESQDDGAWGIYDEPFLQFACQKYSTFSKPFLSAIFTLSSHQPYKTPDFFNQNILSESLSSSEPILKSIRYVDYSLQKFFECAEKQSWFENTLFIITGDHTGPLLKKTEENFQFKQKFQIPLLFYSADQALLKGLDSSELAQQIDILPTLLDLLNIRSVPKNHLARSLYDHGSKSVVLYMDNKYEAITKGNQDSSEVIKAARQYYSEGLYYNKLFYPIEKGNK